MNYSSSGRQYAGCPCGCMTKRPWLIDPDCALPGPYRPPPPFDEITVAPDGTPWFPPSLRDVMEDGGHE